MLSYASALKVPPPEGLMILDAIDNRDMIIDKLLEKINKKFAGLVEENDKLKKTISDISIHGAHDAMMGTTHTPLPSGMVSTTAAATTNPSHIVRRGSDGSLQVVVTESTQKGYELCRPMSSRNYTKYYPYRPNPDDLLPNTDSHLKLYDEISKIVKQNGKKVVLPGHHSLRPPKDLDPKTAMNIDGVDKVWYDYGLFTKKKKFLSALIGVVTDYVSEMVYVEKVLERLDIIVNDMNRDKTLMDAIFAGKLEPGETGFLGIIFKGGNVYKLFTQILDKQLDTNIFQNYLDDVDRYFKKSDCDFGLLFMKYPAGSATKPQVIHLPRSEENEVLVSTLQFIILNKYRNDFLNEGVGFEYLSMCGKNDVVMTSKMNKMAKTMMTIVLSTRLEFEQRVYKILLNTIDFVNNDGSVSVHKRYLSKDIIDAAMAMKPQTYETHTFLGILSSAQDLKKCVNTNSKPTYGVVSASIVEWYKFFLAYTLRDGSFLPTDPKFKSIRPPKTLLSELQNISTDKAEWRDIKTLYKVKAITNIVIGDHSYPITGASIMKDEDIYESIASQKQFSDSSADITSQRMIALGRLHSNRNDFFIKFSRSNPYKLPSGQVVIDDIMNTKTIPFEPDPATKEDREFITPFYISINKDISGKCARLTSPLAVNNWLLQMKRLADYGSSGYVPQKNKEYIEMYHDLTTHRDKLISKDFKTLNFGLSRLLVSFSVVFETFDTQHFALPLPAEFVDLSYSYEGDYKVLIYERFSGYILFNGSINPVAISMLTTEYNDIINYVHSEQYIVDFMTETKLSRQAAVEHQRIILDALKQQNYNILIRDLGVAKKLYDIAVKLFDAVQLENQLVVRDVDDDSSGQPSGVMMTKHIVPLLKIIKYYTYYGSDFARSITMSNNVLYFPKLSTFILDLYTILFADTIYPWSDVKYAKRLQRYIFFVFVERLRRVNITNILDMMEEMGIKVADINDTTGARTSAVGIDNFLHEVRQDVSYHPYNSLSRTYAYFKYRSHYIKDDDSITMTFDKRGKRRIQSTCGIDKFMFSYHLLDFFDLHQNPDVDANTTYIRSQFIVKTTDSDPKAFTTINPDKIINYTVVSMAFDEANDPDEARRIIEDTPDEIGFYRTETDLNNPFVELPSGDMVRRYRPIISSSSDENIREMVKYLNVVDQVREKLLITVYNYVYDHFMNSTGKLNIVGADPDIMMLNVYEGDIDKILSVM